MTEAELEQKAEKYFEENSEEREYGEGYAIEILVDIKQAFIDGFKLGEHNHNCSMGYCEMPRENENLKNDVTLYKSRFVEKCTEVDNLNAQIEKMKCCFNCKHRIGNGGKEEGCDGCWKYASKKDFENGKKRYLHWESIQ